MSLRFKHLFVPDHISVLLFLLSIPSKDGKVLLDQNGNYICFQVLSNYRIY